MEIYHYLPLPFTIFVFITSWTFWQKSQLLYTVRNVCIPLRVAKINIFDGKLKLEIRDMIQNCLLHIYLQIWIATFFHKMYIFLFNTKKNTIENPKFIFLTKICEIRKKRKFAKLFVSIRFTNFVGHSFCSNVYFSF